jgi:hypothetical protein
LRLQCQELLFRIVRTPWCLPSIQASVMPGSGLGRLCAAPQCYPCAMKGERGAGGRRGSCKRHSGLCIGISSFARSIGFCTPAQEPADTNAQLQGCRISNQGGLAGRGWMRLNREGRSGAGGIKQPWRRCPFRLTGGPSLLSFCLRRAVPVETSTPTGH